MNTETTIYQLENQLKLKGMAAKMKSFMEMPYQSRPTLEMAIAEMIEAELIHRKNVKTEKLLKASKLRFKTPLQDIVCSTERNLTRNQIDSLGTCDFILQGRHVIITGKAGCGKTWLSCAIGRQACLLGYKVAFFNMIKFSEEVTTASLTGNFLKYMEKLMKYDLIILDDFALRSIDEQTRIALYQLLDGNKENYRLSIIITSQLPTEDWYDYLKPGSQTESILDRLFSYAEKITLRGKSLRKKEK